MTEEKINTRMEELQGKINYTFKNIDLLKQAMCSIRLQRTQYDGKNNKEYTNEALALVGDTLLKTFIANRLYTKILDKGNYPRKGYITILKAKLESNKIYHKIMQDEGLWIYAYNEYYFADQPCMDHERVRSNDHDPYIEAITAAIFYDSDFYETQKWFNDWLFPLIKKYLD